MAPPSGRGSKAAPGRRPVARRGRRVGRTAATGGIGGRGRPPVGLGAGPPAPLTCDMRLPSAGTRAGVPRHQKLTAGRSRLSPRGGNEADHDAASAEAGGPMGATPETDDGNRLEIFVALVEACEAERRPTEAPVTGGPVYTTPRRPYRRRRSSRGDAAHGTPGTRSGARPAPAPPARARQPVPSGRAAVGRRVGVRSGPFSRGVGGGRPFMSGIVTRRRRRSEGRRPGCPDSAPGDPRDRARRRRRRRSGRICAGAGTASPSDRGREPA